MTTVWVLEHASANDHNIREGVFAQAADVLSAPSGWLDTVRGWIDTAGGLRYGVDTDTAMIWFEEGTYGNDRIELSPSIIWGTGEDEVTPNLLQEARHVLFLLVVKLNTGDDGQPVDGEIPFPCYHADDQQIAGSWRLVREDGTVR